VDVDILASTSADFVSASTGISRQVSTSTRVCEWVRGTDVKCSSIQISGEGRTMK